MTLAQIIADASNPTVMGCIGAGFVVAWGVLEKLRSGRNASIKEALKAKDEIIAAKDQRHMEMLAAQEQEHAEFIKHRKETHDKLNEYNSKMFLLSEENGALRARPDLSPIMEAVRSINEVQLRILQILDRIAENLNLSK